MEVTSGLIAIPALRDNYIWCWRLMDGSWAVMDPGESQNVLTKFKNISYVFITHHHDDHTSGVSEIKSKRPNVTVVGPKGSHKELDEVVSDGDEFLGMRVIATPGHTLDHIIYIRDKWAFVGDHLFKYGCGRVFETDLETMYESLQKLKDLPGSTLCFPAHEYTMSNLDFTKAYKPFTGIETVIKKNKKLSITLPMLLSEQLSNNPFLACKDLSEFIMLRQAKDVFC